MKKGIYTICETVWLYRGMGNWHFVTLPKKESAEIKEHFGARKRGWGSLPVSVTIGNTTWETSIFPDRKSNSYLLPLKANVRIKENIRAGDTITFSLHIRQF